MQVPLRRAAFVLKMAFQMEEFPNLGQHLKKELDFKYLFLNKSIQRHCSLKQVSNST